MAIFRVEKNKNYTVMSNYHLRDKTLSLKAKGLLSQMLSLPDDWNYTLEGLASLNKEKIDAIRTAVKELETAGYIERSRERDEKGRLGDTIYVIHEQPEPHEKPEEYEQPEPPAAPDASEPMGDPEPQPKLSNAAHGQKSSPVTSAQMGLYRDIIHENIDYDILVCDNDPDEVEEIAELMTETVCSNRKSVRISGADFPIDRVKSRFLKLNHDHIQFVLDGLAKNTSSIRNMKAYLLASIWNAPVTMNTFYHTQANHDLSFFVP